MSSSPAKGRRHPTDSTMKPGRIAYICADPGVPVFGCKGASIHVQEFLRAVLARGMRVDLFTPRPGPPPPPDLRAVRVHCLPPVAGSDPKQRERRVRDLNRPLRTALDREGGFDLVYERYSLFTVAGYASDAHVPGLLEVNAPLIEEQARWRVLADRCGAERASAAVFERATAILAVSRPIAAWLDEWRAARGRVHVVPNGVDPRRFRPMGPRPPGGTFTVGFVGSLKPWHGLDILIEAIGLLAASDSSWRLVVVGDGPERAALEHSVAGKGLGAMMTFTGSVPHAEVPRLLGLMDVAVAPYPDLPGAYFSPLKVFEYLATGLPVVASRIGQLAEVIEDGKTGTLCRPGDPGALAEALARLRASPAKRRALGRAGRAAVASRYTWDLVVDRTLELAGLVPGQRRHRAGIPVAAGMEPMCAPGRRS